MGCAPCAKRRQKWAVRLPGGLKVNQPSEEAALDFAKRHPGSRVIKG